jgi:plastocyanin
MTEVQVGLEIGFNPHTITVTAGETVVWVFETGSHSVTADDGSFDSGVRDHNTAGVKPLGTKATFFHEFDTPGQYPYHCMLHKNKTGLVIVV